jgi:hypothetical protein
MPPVAFHMKLHVETWQKLSGHLAELKYECSYGHVNWCV